MYIEIILKVHLGSSAGDWIDGKLVSIKHGPDRSISISRRGIRHGGGLRLPHLSGGVENAHPHQELPACVSDSKIHMAIDFNNLSIRDYVLLTPDVYLHQVLQELFPDSGEESGYAVSTVQGPRVRERAEGHRYPAEDEGEEGEV